MIERRIPHIVLPRVKELKMGDEGCHVVPTHEHPHGDDDLLARGALRPKCIGANVISALEHQDLGASDSARGLW